MYHWISQFVPESFAVPVTAFVYAVMLILTLYYSFEQEAEFNYLVL